MFTPARMGLNRELAYTALVPFHLAIPESGCPACFRSSLTLNLLSCPDSHNQIAPEEDDGSQFRTN